MYVAKMTNRDVVGDFCVRVNDAFLFQLVVFERVRRDAEQLNFVQYEHR